MGIRKTFWDISKRPHTKDKLKILRKCFEVWITIWNKQSWISNEWYVVDLFAGRGKYVDKGKPVSGSPLIFLESIERKRNRLRPDLKIRLFFVEKSKKNYNLLRKNIEKFLEDYPGVQPKVEIKIILGDCNVSVDDILSDIQSTTKKPLFLFIDPSGIQIKKATVQKIVGLKNPKDIIFNYIVEGVRRASGVAKKARIGKKLNIKEIKTIETLSSFIGEDVTVIDVNDVGILEEYVSSIFTAMDLKVIAYDMKYSDRNDILYYLLFASRKDSITNIIKDIFATQKAEKTLFDKDYYENGIVSIMYKLPTIKRKSLLYKTGVEYGNWTINHVEGCMHGCKFPCYAFMMSKKFGRIQDYDDWRKPKIVTNALDLLESEIPKHKNEIDFVHLCFMTDPFMFDVVKHELVSDVKNLTLKIIERLNRENIRVTTLTKGIYPKDLFEERYSKDNEYGITLVSLNAEFQQQFEPFSAPYNERISSLQQLAKGGLKTWASIEPYPTPNLDKTAEQVESLLEQINFVDKIIFGKLNYNVASSKFKNNGDYYGNTAKKVIEFCKAHHIKYHIKSGTPLFENTTKSIFKN